MRIDAVPIGKNPPHDINVIIEVPVGGEPIKYEMDKDAGALYVDRFLYTPMRYPGNYGFVPHTLCGDGDPIDVLIANQRAIVPGAIMSCRPVGVLKMRDEGGEFGGEVSGHYYFKAFYNADSGTIPALLILELLSKRETTLAELLHEFRSKYFISGEINSTVADQRAKMDEIKQRYADARITELDGVSVDYDDWHFNVRPSNTEPLLRLNAEGKDTATMEQVRDDVLKMIRSES